VQQSTCIQRRRRDSKQVTKSSGSKHFLSATKSLNRRHVTAARDRPTDRRQITEHQIQQNKTEAAVLRGSLTTTQFERRISWWPNRPDLYKTHSTDE